MDLRFLRLRRWLLKQQPNKTVFNRFIENQYQSGCNGLGRGSDRTVPRNDPDGTFRKRLLPVLLIQIVTLRRESNHLCELQ